MLILREAQPQDSDLITQYIRELADFQKLIHECTANNELVQTWLFGENPRAGSILAEFEGIPAGFAVYFYNFCTFLTQPGIYIEDIYVRSEFRRKGIAKNMFQYFAQKALTEGYKKIEFSVLHWNIEAIEFYRSIGAIPKDEWQGHVIHGEALHNLATR